MNKKAPTHVVAFLLPDGATKLQSELLLHCSENFEMNMVSFLSHRRDYRKIQSDHIISCLCISLYCNCVKLLFRRT